MSPIEEAINKLVVAEFMEVPIVGGLNAEMEHHRRNLQNFANAILVESKVQTVNIIRQMVHNSART